jgi:hypothetical protein
MGSSWYGLLFYADDADALALLLLLRSMLRWCSRVVLLCGRALCFCASYGAPVTLYSLFSHRHTPSVPGPLRGPGGVRPGEVGPGWWVTGYPGWPVACKSSSFILLGCCCGVSLHESRRFFRSQPDSARGNGGNKPREKNPVKLRGRKERNYS